MGAGVRHGHDSLISGLPCNDVNDHDNSPFNTLQQAAGGMEHGLHHFDAYLDL